MTQEVQTIRYDKTGRELVKHGTTMLPISYYEIDLEKFRIDWHWHDDLEAVVVTEGEAVFSVGNEQHTVREGEALFINHGVIHGGWVSDFSGCKFRSIVFHQRLISGSIDSVFYQKYVSAVLENRMVESIHLKPSVEWQKVIIDAINEAWECCNAEPKGYEFRVRRALSDMIYHIWDNLSETQSHPDAKVMRDEDRIKTMLKFIHNNYSGEMTIKMIAESALVSESECLRCFRRTIGTTPIQYVKQYRIQAASQMLVSTQKKVADIAVQCGFQDISYFTKSFRKFKGCVPTEYRRNNL